MKLRVAVGADHGGFSLKNELIAGLYNDYEVLDCGADEYNPDDYPAGRKMYGNKSYAWLVNTMRGGMELAESARVRTQVQQAGVRWKNSLAS